jgi:mono/diheme cytochrome c family protein
MRTTHRTGRTAICALAAAALVAVASGAFADEAEKDETKAYSAFNGGMTYKNYCANCHGATGKGDGYIADTLKVRPADLTLLAKRNGGVFPVERVTVSIDGEKAVAEHGSREMPVWGDVLLWPEGDSPERREHVKTKIGELVEHLRTLQAN